MNIFTAGMQYLRHGHGIENKPDVYRGVDCTRRFCGTLRQHAIKINNFEKKKTIPLTSEQK